MLANVLSSLQFVRAKQTVKRVGLAGAASVQHIAGDDKPLSALDTATHVGGIDQRGRLDHRHPGNGAVALSVAQIALSSETRSPALDQEIDFPSRDHCQDQPIAMPGGSLSLSFRPKPRSFLCSSPFGVEESKTIAFDPRIAAVGEDVIVRASLGDPAASEVIGRSASFVFSGHRHPGQRRLPGDAARQPGVAVRRRMSAVSRARLRRK